MSGVAIWITKRKFPCGTRAAYVNGCRCEPCTAANRTYARERWRAQRLKGDWNGLVDAAPARTHILRLSRSGVGYKSIAAASDVSHSTLLDIKKGRKLNVRARTARRILAVDAGARGDASLVSARSTWRLIERLLEEGFAKAALARRMGLSRSIQFGKSRVLARTKLRVEKLYRAATT